MTSMKTTSFPLANTIDGSEILGIVQGGINVQTIISDIRGPGGSGATGPTGPSGPTGATGPAGGGSTIFASVKTYGAIGNGIADDTAAIRAAVTANGNGSLYFPPGTYKISSNIPVSVSNIQIFGAGAGSVITTTSTTADMFTVTGQHVEIQGLYLTSVAKTAGSFVNSIEANYLRVREFTMIGGFTGITISGSGDGGPTNVKVSHGSIMDLTSGTGNGIVVNSGVDLVLEHIWIHGEIGANLANGVLVNACGDLLLSHVSTVYAGNGLGMAPASGAIVQSLVATNCYFDSGSGAGIAVEAAGTVQLLKVSNSWAASNSSGGIILNTSGFGQVQQTDIINTVISNNSSHGMNINTTGVAHTTVIGSTFSANLGCGLLIQAGVNWFKVVGCTLGQSGEFVANSTWGIILGNNCSNFLISHNIVDGNPSGAIASGTPVGNYIIKDNVPVADGSSGAPLNSPNFTGVPTAPTASTITNNTQLATTAYVQSLFASKSLGSSGYQGIPGGLTFQWGIMTTGGGGTGTITFPLTFANAFLQATASLNMASPTDIGVGLGAQTTSGMSVSTYNASNGAGISASVSWIAIGW